MALQAMLPNPEYQPLKRVRGQHLLSAQREELALMLQATLEQHRRLLGLVAINDEMWRGLLGEDAPDLRVTAAS